MTDLVSRPYHPDPKKCCELCIFGTGKHADWCVAITDEFIEDVGIPEGLVRVGRDRHMHTVIFQRSGESYASMILENRAEMAELANT